MDTDVLVDLIGSMIHNLGFDGMKVVYGVQ